MKILFFIYLIVLFSSCTQVKKDQIIVKEETINMGDNNQENFDVDRNTEEKKILNEFKKRRAIFDNYIEMKRIDLFTCPSCGYPTLTERRIYDICDICNWEDDGQDDKSADETWGGPNGSLSLTESRLIIGKELQNHADSLNGTIIKDPEKFLLIFKAHNLRMKEANSKIKGDTPFNDPLWDEWKRTIDLIKNDLIEKN